MWLQFFFLNWIYLITHLWDIYTYLVIYLKQDLLVVVVYCAGRDVVTKQKSRIMCDRIMLRMHLQTHVRCVEKHARTSAVYSSILGYIMSTKPLVAQSAGSASTVKHDYEGKWVVIIVMGTGGTSIFPHHLDHPLWLPLKIYEFKSLYVWNVSLNSQLSLKSPSFSRNHMISEIR